MQFIDYVHLKINEPLTLSDQNAIKRFEIDLYPLELWG